MFSKFKCDPESMYAFAKVDHHSNNAIVYIFSGSHFHYLPIQFIDNAIDRC